jgi:glucose/arabinose dehydrogenase
MKRVSFALAATTVAMLGLLSCDDPLLQPNTPGLRTERPLAAVVPPPAASVQVTVQVPVSMRTSPFNVTRTLTVPPNFTIAVYTRISGARFMAPTPDGNLLVSQPSTGKILLVRPNGSGDPLISDFATGLRSPHDMVFRAISGTTWLYVAESHQINRYVFTAGDQTAQGRQVIIAGLPDAGGHPLKNIALDASNKLYVSIASSCNACASDTQSNPARGSIYQYNADGTGGRLFARGLRNAEGLDFVPGTSTLWVVVNNRDNIGFPSHSDWDGDGSDDYGKVMPSYVDNHPPEEFTSVRDGGNYGWPFCNPNPDTPAGLNNMPFDRDVELNPTGSALDCASADRIVKGIQAHSAPLGVSFLHGSTFPSAYRSGAAVGYHGSWNRTQKTGYKVALFPWDDVANLPGNQQDLVTGWATASSNWGRPVDVAVDAGGALLISDDQANAIYKLVYAQAPPPPPPPPQTLEAENGAVTGAVIDNRYRGYTGSGYVDFTASGQSIEWTINSAAAGSRTLTFRYSLRKDTRPLQVSVNGVVVNPGLSFPGTKNWTDWRTVSVTVTLNAGNNTIRVTSTQSDAPNVDNVVISG